jgi:uncharacterized protein (TIGR03435 family)
MGRTDGKRSRRLVSGSAIRVVWLFVATCGMSGVLVQGQEHQTKPLRFEVVSVKRNTSNTEPFKMQVLPDGIHIRNMPLLSLIRVAYGVFAAGEKTVVGFPDWVKTERFDVDAKIEEDDITSFKVLPFDSQIAMLQSILESRFQVHTHKETKQLPIYSLVVAEGGFKGNVSGIAALDYKASGGLDPQTIRITGGKQTASHLIGHAVSMASLASTLTQQVDRPVIDQTGLTGNFDVDISWSPQFRDSEFDASENDPAPSDPDVSSIFTVLREKLGLRLKPSNGAVVVLVVDHVEEASSN